tara:strand:+ start:795 stop:1331 length:537 start_codon:yes stop_codon:yes gene_type:complete
MILYELIFPFDYVLVILMFLIIIFSGFKGFINSILGLLTWVGAILLTIYTYETFSNFLSKQILNINFFQNYEYLSSIISVILSIPIIFLASIFILKRIRIFLTSDMDKNIVGLIFDKIFGLIYGFIFFYIVLTTSIILLEKFNLSSFSNWLHNNSLIIQNIDHINNKYLIIINSDKKI